MADDTGLEWKTYPYGQNNGENCMEWYERTIKLRKFVDHLTTNGVKTRAIEMEHVYNGERKAILNHRRKSSMKTYREGMSSERHRMVDGERCFEVEYARFWTGQ